MGIWEELKEAEKRLRDAVNRAIGNVKDFSDHPKESLHQINNALPEPVRVSKELIDNPKGRVEKEAVEFGGFLKQINPLNLFCTAKHCSDHTPPVATPAQPRQNNRGGKDKH